MWVKRDHEAEWKEWERRLETIAAAVEKFASVSTEIRQPGRSNVAPILGITWDQEKLPINGGDVKRQLSEGNPRIEVFAGNEGFSVMPYMMQEGDDEKVVERLTEIFSGIA